MYPNQVRGHLSHMRFRDWRFTLPEHAQRMYVNTPSAIDNYTGKPTPFTFSFKVPDLANAEECASWVMGKVEKIVLHEAQEQFFFHGERLFDPHAGGKGSLCVDTSRLIVPST